MELSDLSAPLDEATFAALAQDLVDDGTTGVRPVRRGRRASGRLRRRLGLAFEHRAVLIAEGPRHLFMTFESPQRALSRLSTLGPMRLIWPAAAPTP